MARQSPVARTAKRNPPMPDPMTSTTEVPFTPSDLQARYKAAGIIQPGASEGKYDTSTGFQNPITVIKNLLKRKPKKVTP